MDDIPRDRVHTHARAFSLQIGRGSPTNFQEKGLDNEFQPLLLSDCTFFTKSANLVLLGVNMRCNWTGGVGGGGGGGGNS